VLAASGRCPYTSLALLDPQLRAQAASQQLLNPITPPTNVHPLGRARAGWGPRAWHHQRAQRLCRSRDGIPAPVTPETLQGHRDCSNARSPAPPCSSAAPAPPAPPLRWIPLLLWCFDRTLTPRAARSRCCQQLLHHLLSAEDSRKPSAGWQGAAQPGTPT